MRKSQAKSLSKQWRLIIVVVAAAALLLKLYLALKTNGSLDVPGFEDWLKKVRQVGVLETYHLIGAFGNPFNHTPLIPQLLRVMGFLADSTHLPFKFWLRVPAILADVGSLLLVWKILERSRQMKLPISLLLMAACPISILVSGFHGQVDPVMIFFLLLSLYLIETKQPLWLAGIVFGMSMSIKVVPIIFVPAVFLYLPKPRQRVMFFLFAGVFLIAVSLPYILQEPVTVLKAMFGYGSIYGAWGWTRLAVWLSGVDPHINGNSFLLTDKHALFAKLGRYFMLCAICVVSFWLNRKEKRPPLFLQCGLIAFLFMFLTPGYGVQYQSWLVPWPTALGLRPLGIYYAVGSIYLVREYVCWACWGTFPTTCASAIVSALGLACWCSIFIVLLFYGRALKEPIAENT